MYDGDGNRFTKTVAGVTNQYLVDDLKLAYSKRLHRHVKRR